MCRAIHDGGQRCAAHTRRRLDHAAASLRDAVATGTPAQIARAHLAWDQAAVDYASTPTGHTEFLNRARAAVSTGDHDTAAMLHAVLTRGEALRAANATTKDTLSHRPSTERPLQGPAEATDTSAAPTAPVPGDLVAAISATMPNALTPTERATLAAHRRAIHEAAAIIANPDSTPADLDHALTLTTRTHTSPDLTRFGPLVHHTTRRHYTHVLDHPNANDHTRAALLPHLGTHTVLTHPTATSHNVAHACTTTDLDPATWDHLVTRAEYDTPIAAAVAINHPNPAARAEAAERVLRANPDTLTDTDLPLIHATIQHMNHDPLRQAHTEMALITWATRYATPVRRRLVLTQAARSPFTRSRNQASAQNGHVA